MLCMVFQWVLEWNNIEGRVAFRAGRNDLGAIATEKFKASSASFKLLTNDSLLTWWKRLGGCCSVLQYFLFWVLPSQFLVTGLILFCWLLLRLMVIIYFWICPQWGEYALNEVELALRLLDQTLRIVLLKWIVSGNFCRSRSRSSSSLSSVSQI